MEHTVIVADTDLVIDFLRGRGPGNEAVQKWLGDGRLRVTAVTAFELRLGQDFPRLADRLRAFLEPRILPLDLPAAMIAGRCFAELKARGQGIGVQDCLQAGICLRHDLPLGTRNHRHFSRIPDLTLADLDNGRGE